MAKRHLDWPDTCSVEGCSGKYEARGLCAKHYQSARYVAKKRRQPTFEERFWSKVDKRGPDECWNWTGALNMQGYGAVRRVGKNLLAHRIALHLATGAVEINTKDRATDLVLHSCDNKRCCNPAHLAPGTPFQNAQDREARSGYVPPRGTQCGWAKLTEEQVIEIRRDRHIRAEEFARRFGVAASNVYSIRQGARWKHVVVPSESRSAA